MDDLTKFFGHKVRQARTSANLSQEGLAHHAGIDRGYMGHIERGTKSPTLEKVNKIAKALDISPSDLLK
jgi:transcriptional regulator with XRE-family HTH domain